MTRVTFFFQKHVRITLFLAVVLSLALTRDIGLADNGDFTRSMLVYTSGPTNITSNWPATRTPEWNRRFFNYWIPYWKLDWPGGSPVTSSATLLWLPGVFLSAWFYSPSILSIPIMTLPGLAILLACYWLLLRWIEARGIQLLYLTLALPIALLVSDANYVSYLNSFYQEGAAFVFLIALVVSSAWLIETKSWLALISTLLLCFLLATTKASYFYWPILGFGLCIWHAVDWRSRLVVMLLSIASFIMSLSQLPATSDMQANSAGQSLFAGALTFSDAPNQRLKELGFDGMNDCVGENRFSLIGMRCFEQYKAKISYWTVARVFLAEPIVAMRLMRFAGSNMQIVFVSSLGHYAEDDPRAGIGNPLPLGLSLWSTLKQKVFPVGDWLFATLIAIVAVALALSRLNEAPRSLILISVVAAIGCVTEMVVAVVGDGKPDIIKHLFIANVLFDMSLISTVSAIVALKFRRVPTQSIASQILN